MTKQSINLKEKFSKFSEHWSPRVVAERNDYQFKLANIEGSMSIEFRDDDKIIRTLMI